MTDATLPNNIFDTLKNIGQEDRETMKMLIGLYVEQAPDLITSIESVKDEKNVIELKKAAHTLKGVCLNLGFTPLGDICRDIEVAATENDFNRVNTLYDKLVETQDLISSKLDQL